MKKTLIILSFILSFNFSNYNCDYCKSFQEMLENKEILNFLHLEDKNRRILFIPENKYCKLDIELLKNLTIRTLPNKDIESQKNIIFLENVEVINKKEYKITLYYPIEGVYFEGYFKNSKLFKIITIEK